MEALEAIMSRKSVRNFSSRCLEDSDLEIILKAGMSGPSSTNARDWSFVAVRDRDMLKKMADTNGIYAAPLKKAAAGILICGDLVRAYRAAPEYWIIDCSIAGQNISLAAHAMGMGSVWLGIYPQMDRVRAQSALLGLPETTVPHSILALGYSDEDAQGRRIAEVGKFEEDRVHYEKW